MSIRPKYASAIFKGSKLFEFRRTIFKRDIDVVVVYVTAPVMRVIGEFDVQGVIHAAVPDLWQRTSLFAGIEEEPFFEYFTGRERGYAIEVGEVRLYEEPLRLEEHFGIRPPQSFIYLDFPWPLQC